MPSFSANTTDEGSSPPPTVSSNTQHYFGTADGHNPEIIYHLLEGQSRLSSPMLFNDLDAYLRREGPSDEQLQLERQQREQEEHSESDADTSLIHIPPAAPSPPRFGAPRYSPPSSAPSVSTGNASSSPSSREDLYAAADAAIANRPTEGTLLEGAEALSEPVIYERLTKRLSTRTSTDLEQDTDDILERDYLHGVSPLFSPHSLVAHMTTRSGEKHAFSPGWEGAADAPMPEGPFEADTRKTSEWERGIDLATGRHGKHVLYSPGGPYPRLEDAVEVLGFPDLPTFEAFIHRPDIKAAFRELWDAHLGDVPGDREIPYTDYSRRPVALRIFYARSREGCSEFDAVRPRKAGWEASSHLARFCLQVEKVCQPELLPPIRGQLPILREKAATSVVAWAGIELARVLRRLQKGLGSRVRYLDDRSSVAA